MFHLWERLPTELKLAILKAAVLQARPVTHVHHAIALDGDLGALIGTQNKEVVELALAACKICSLLSWRFTLTTVK